ncbi:MAG: mRNA surveillance protein pelota, partial [Methanomethylophilus sp.]
ATVAVLRQNGLKEVVALSAGRGGKDYEEKARSDDYHARIIAKLKTIADPSMPLVVLGPGFEKEGLADDLQKLPKGTLGRVYVQHTGQNGMVGVNELIRSGLGAQVLRDSTVGVEMEAVAHLMEEISKDGLATYGPGEVRAAADAGAVDTLLVLDSVLREKDLDDLVRAVEAQSGKVLVVSDGHDGGRQLAALGGLGALLRYKLG